MAEICVARKAIAGHRMCGAPDICATQRPLTLTFSRSPDIGRGNWRRGNWEGEGS